MSEKESKPPATTLELKLHHVDEFVEDMGHGDTPEMGDAMYARWWLMHARLPAYMAMNFARFMQLHRLYCTHEGKRWRCTGASRMGDVWLAKDHNRETGYDKRVDLDTCTNWGPNA